MLICPKYHIRYAKVWKSSLVHGSNISIIKDILGQLGILKTEWHYESVANLSRYDNDGSVMRKCLCVFQMHTEVFIGKIACPWFILNYLKKKLMKQIWQCVNMFKAESMEEGPSWGSLIPSLVSPMQPSTTRNKRKSPRMRKGTVERVCLP